MGRFPMVSHHWLKLGEFILVLPSSTGSLHIVFTMFAHFLAIWWVSPPSDPSDRLHGTRKGPTWFHRIYPNTIRQFPPFIPWAHQQSQLPLRWTWCFLKPQIFPPLFPGTIVPMWPLAQRWPNVACFAGGDLRHVFGHRDDAPSAVPGRIPK